MISKTADNDVGYKINVQAGKIIDKEEKGCSKGTTITVTDLFFNTPVRYKFLKKDFTEAGYIEDVMTRIALIHPEIAIKLISSGKTIIQTSGNGDIKSIVYNIYGKDIADNIIETNYEYEDIKITGVVGKPAIARSNRGNQMFFVNKRFIKDKTLTSATEQAFKGLLTIGKYGFLILNIEMNPSKVDVNVHPAKLEVRFQDENTIFKAVYHAIKETLLKGELVPEDRPVEIKKQIEETPEPTTEERKETIKFSDLLQKMSAKKEKDEETPFEYKSNVIEQIYSNRHEIKEDKEKYNLRTDLPENDKISKMDTQIIDSKEINKKILEPINNLNNIKMESNNDNFEEMYVKTFGNLPKQVVSEEPVDETKVKKEELETTEKISVFDNMDNKAIPKYKFIGIAFATYIIVEFDSELYIIDQHAAHERIMYEKIKKNFYSEGEKDSQLMLLPDIINLTHKEMDIAKDNIPIFEKAGFMLEQFGENTIKLTGVPNICIDLDTKELFLETLDEINTVARTAKQEIEEKFIATLACKSAVKANMILTKEEVDNLMNQLLVLPNPFTCPHGRPTAIHLTKNDIEKKFSRR